MDLLSLGEALRLLSSAITVTGACIAIWWYYFPRLRGTCTLSQFHANPHDGKIIQKAIDLVAANPDSHELLKLLPIISEYSNAHLGHTTLVGTLDVRYTGRKRLKNVELALPGVVTVYVRKVGKSAKREELTFPYREMRIIELGEMSKGDTIEVEFWIRANADMVRKTIRLSHAEGAGWVGVYPPAHPAFAHLTKHWIKYIAGLFITLALLALALAAA